MDYMNTIIIILVGGIWVSGLMFIWYIIRLLITRIKAGSEYKTDIKYLKYKKRMKIAGWSIIGVFASLIALSSLTHKELTPEEIAAQNARTEEYIQKRKAEEAEQKANKEKADEEAKLIAAEAEKKAQEDKKNEKIKKDTENALYPNEREFDLKFLLSTSRCDDYWLGSYYLNLSEETIPKIATLYGVSNEIKPYEYHDSDDNKTRTYPLHHKSLDSEGFYGTLYFIKHYNDSHKLDKIEIVLNTQNEKKHPVLVAPISFFNSLCANLITVLTNKNIDDINKETYDATMKDYEKMVDELNEKSLFLFKKNKGDMTKDNYKFTLKRDNKEDIDGRTLTFTAERK